MKPPKSIDIRNIKNYTFYFGILLIGVAIFLSSCEEDPASNESFEAIISIEANDISLTEGAGSGSSIMFNLDKENTSGSAINVKYTVSGTATSGEDYEALNGTAQIDAGSNSVEIPVAIIDDNELEGEESIIITLSTSNLPQGVTISGTSSVTITINDNDSRTITVSATDNIALEGDNDGLFTITMDQALASSIQINYILSGTATAGQDYASLNGIAEIQAGETSTEIVIDVTDDTNVETDETVILTLSTQQIPGLDVGTSREATVTISDNDEMAFSAEATVSATVSSAAEGGNDGEFTVSLDQTNTSGSNIAIAYTVTGTATNGTDYNTLNGSVEIPNGSSSAVVSVNVTDDSEVESDETVIITLDSTQPNGITVGSSDSATVTISDNDEESFTAEVSLVASDETALEGDNNAEFTVSLNQSNNTGSAISIAYTITGTATNGDDYTTLSGIVDIPDGSLSAIVSVEVIDDTEIESDETVILTINSSQVDGISVGAENTATIVISDNDVAPFTAEVSIVATDATALEGDNNGEYTISLDKTNTLGETISIMYTVSGTATGDSDYSALSGSVDIPNGSSSAIVTLNVLDDTEVESDETVIVTLDITQQPGITVGSENSATVVISDNDTSSETISFTIGATTGNSITIDSWTVVSGVDGYVIIVSDDNSFNDITASTDLLASTTYVGYGDQIIYQGTGSNSITVTMLSYEQTYYFKAVTYTGSTFDNSQNPESAASISCSTTSTTESQVCFDIATDTRTISSNQYPSHATGNFPNADPTATQVTRVLDLSPSNTGSATYVYNETGPPTPSNKNFYKFGIASNGVEFHPMGLQPWTNPDSGEQNWEWQAKVTEPGETDLDNYGAHVTSQGNYHYHGDIVGLAANEDGSRHSLLYGYAADGFPIYYKYGYVSASDPTSGIKELVSSYQLKSGTRTGTGTAGKDYPDGTYDGTYIQDYEYVNGLGDLDECNGRTGVTPEFPSGTYYYVITADFPVTPNCFKGTPESDWIIGN